MPGEKSAESSLFKCSTFFPPGNFSRGEKSENDSDDSALLFFTGGNLPGEKSAESSLFNFQLFFSPGEFSPGKIFWEIWLPWQPMLHPTVIIKKKYGLKL